MKDLGEARRYLGFEISRNRDTKTLTLSQSCYTSKIIQRFQMSNANPCCTPLETNISYLFRESETAHDKPYREAFGSLMYLMVSIRPDISFSVGMLSKFVERPLLCHWKALKHVLRYLVG